MPTLLDTPNQSISVAYSCSHTDASSSSNKLISPKSTGYLLTYDSVLDQSSRHSTDAVNQTATNYNMADSPFLSRDQKSNKTSATTSIMNLPSCSKTTINDYTDIASADQSMNDTTLSHKTSNPSGFAKAYSPVNSNEIQAVLSYRKFF